MLEMNLLRRLATYAAWTFMVFFVLWLLLFIGIYVGVFHVE